MSGQLTLLRGFPEVDERAIKRVMQSNVCCGRLDKGGGKESDSARLPMGGHPASLPVLMFQELLAD